MSTSARAYHKLVDRLLAQNDRLIALLERITLQHQAGGSPELREDGEADLYLSDLRGKAAGGDDFAQALLDDAGYVAAVRDQLS